MRRSATYSGLMSSGPHATRVAKANKRRDTKPELLLRKALGSEGIRYRVHYDKVPGNPDVAIVRDKIAIFCDGDFWHGRNWEERKAKLEHGANPEYWVAKIGRNIERDREVGSALCRRGWTVVRVWESEVNKDPRRVARRTRRIQESRRRDES